MTSESDSGSALLGFRAALNHTQLCPSLLRAIARASTESTLQGRALFHFGFVILLPSCSQQLDDLWGVASVVENLKHPLVGA